MPKQQSDQYIRWFEHLNNDDVSIVGGKNASLGEMIQALKKEQIRVPDGFATTADAYRKFLRDNGMNEKISNAVKAYHDGNQSLEKTGKSIRMMFIRNPLPETLEEAICKAYEELCTKYKYDEVDVAVRSSATAEDLPTASFAGQQETYLNISGEDELLEAVKKCYASLFTDRAISYRDEKGFDHLKVALSVGVQKMVRSDQAGSGVMFSIDTETGFPDVVVINAAWGLGENVVQGSVNPDEYQVFKPLLKEKDRQPVIEKTLGSKEKKMVYAKGGSETVRNKDTAREERNRFVLTDDEILTLARWALAIEAHYEKAMDMEWAKDGETGDLFIVQARPETVQSQKQASTLKAFHLNETGDMLLKGLSIGSAIAAGKAQVIRDAGDISQFDTGNILITGMTDPDWVPIMKKAAGIVTDFGGRTSHAAIVSRELGIPAVVGTEEATATIEEGKEITLSCAEGDVGKIYKGKLDFESREIEIGDIPETRTQIKMNMASPAAAFRWWRLPSDGIGLARMEFIINNIIKIHPMALIEYDKLEDKHVRKQIDTLTRGYKDRTDYFVQHLAMGIAKLSASQYPKPVIVRMSDFKTNEYADLIGGKLFEPNEDNPMLGFRGASRYYSDHYRPGFELECRAIKRVREVIGMDNVIMMIPFCRTPEEADRVLDVLEKNGLQKGENGLKVFVMAEIPSNIFLADQFAERFDGFSIGSNDLTQLVLGVDRDSAELSDLFDEQNEAVKTAVRHLIREAHAADTEVGICGQAPSDYPEFAEFLVKEGIDSISLNPDSLMQTREHVAKVEA